MTVSAQTPINRSTGNGVTTVFPYTFKVLQVSDMRVTVGGVVKTLTTDYTVSGVGTESGNVTMLAAPTGVVVLQRYMPYARSIDFQDQGALPAATLDGDQDAPVMMLQQLAEGLSRAVKVDISETMTPEEFSASLFAAGVSAGDQAAAAAASAAAAAASVVTAAASSASALGYLQAYRATSYGALAADPLLDPTGGSPTVGDEYFNTTANLIKRFNGVTWQASDISTANLAASSGASLVGYMPAGTGVVATTVQGKLRENKSTDDVSLISDALDSAGIGGTLLVATEKSVGVSMPVNSGVELTGQKGLYYAPGTGGNRLLNRPGRSAEILQWGQENLVRWLEGLRTGATLKVSLVGDSNTAGYLGGTLAQHLDSLSNVSVTNHAISGTDIEQWRTGSGAFSGSGKTLADVITFDPDLIVMCWGTNDPISARTAGNFSTSLQTALTTIRTALTTQDCSILLMTPNAMSVSGRDELWSKQLRPIIKANAERFECAYYDKNGKFPNSVVDIDVGTSQNKFFDSARVHTGTLGTYMLAADVLSFLAPDGAWGMALGNLPEKSASALASTYAPGFTLTRMADGALNGFAATFNPLSTGGHFAIQFNWTYSGGTAAGFAVRNSPGGVWTSWVNIFPDVVQVVGAVPAGYAVPGSASGLNTQRTGNLTSLSGMLTLSPAAQVISSTTLANIATVAHRPIFNIQDAEVVVINAGGTVERLRADVTTAGNIVVRGTSVMTNATTVSINLVYRGV